MSPSQDEWILIGCATGIILLIALGMVVWYFSDRRRNEYEYDSVRVINQSPNSIQSLQTKQKTKSNESQIDKFHSAMSVIAIKQPSVDFADLRDLPPLKKLSSLSMRFGISLMDDDDDDELKYTEHDLETVDDYILSEKLRDVMDKYNLQYDHEHIEQKMCDEYGIQPINHTLLYQRIENIVFDLQKQHGVYKEPPLLLTKPYQLRVCDKADIIPMDANRPDDVGIQLPLRIRKSIHQMYSDEMGKLLKKYGKHTKQSLIDECNDEKCNDRINDKKNIDQCPCIQRLCVFINIYHEFYAEINAKSLPSKMGDCFVMDGYEYVSLSNDFQHIQKYHLLNNDEMQRFICGQIMEKYKCTSKPCHISMRRSRETKRKKKQHFHHMNLFPRKLDDLHHIFLHSSMIKGCRFNHQVQIEITQDDNDDDDKDDEKKDDAPIHLRKATYDAKADIQWLKNINDIDTENEVTIYKTLVQKIGIFRWQGSTGFTNKNQGALSHMKPKFANVKEEVLNNDFHHLSIDSWNQIILKTQEFKKTFNAEKIRTQQEGSFTDHVFNLKSNWKKGESPTVKEIVVLKLYTDWDSLQSELKKCFRLESVEEIFKQYSVRSPGKLYYSSSAPERQQSPVPNYMGRLKHLKTEPWNASMLLRGATFDLSSDRDEFDALERRLEQFYHWRGKLIMFIHKFATILKPTYYDTKEQKEVEFILYHGINTKMILSPSATGSFHGPLSTTSSYQVAVTFATNKGMVLSISSQYPRLGMCNAFNASSISDYPEEQEWLIGHIYLRLRQIFIKRISEPIAIETKIRHAFFAIHLFREQMFSMNQTLEDCIIPFIQIHLFKEASTSSDQSIYEDIVSKDYKSDYYQYLSNVIKWKKSGMEISNSPKMKGVLSLTRKDEQEKSRIFYLLLKKFEEVCKQPNKMQTIKLDCLSSRLKPYFLEKNKLNEWIVSFRKIINLFPNIEEIHFLNWYRFDDDVLKALITQIKRKSNKLRQIKFLYFDYRGELIKHPFFFNPILLKLESGKIFASDADSNDWKISYPQHSNSKNGYCIKLKSN